MTPKMALEDALAWNGTETVAKHANDDSVRTADRTPTAMHGTESEFGAGQMRGVLRTLSVLRQLGDRKRATVLELSRATGISRGALYRILETLREAGYVTLELSDTRYCLSNSILGLTRRFTRHDLVAEVTRPILRELQRQIFWPADLSSIEGKRICITETTRPFSTVTIKRNVIGQLFPMLTTASGRAYLAWCPTDERDALLTDLILEPDIPAKLRDRAAVESLLEETRLQGYALRDGEAPMETGAIAVAIVLDENVLGCLTITFKRGTLSLEEVIGRCVPPMWSAATKIAREVSRSAMLGTASHAQLMVAR